jgi:hypothetical protein
MLLPEVLYRQGGKTPAHTLKCLILFKLSSLTEALTPWLDER